MADNGEESGRKRGTVGLRRRGGRTVYIIIIYRPVTRQSGGGDKTAAVDRFSVYPDRSSYPDQINQNTLRGCSRLIKSICTYIYNTRTWARESANLRRTIIVFYSPLSLAATAKA